MKQNKQPAIVKGLRRNEKKDAKRCHNDPAVEKKIIWNSTKKIPRTNVDHERCLDQSIYKENNNPNKLSKLQCFKNLSEHKK